MTQESIFIPFFGLMLLTLTVWLYMYFLRISYLRREKVNLQSVATARQVVNKVPEKINYPSENFTNLFELPVLFYVICMFLYITRSVDTVYLALAYGFLTFRIGHSINHCTSNIVKWRFVFYLLSSIILWTLITRAILSIFNA